jgi:hypothetical protein
MPAQNDAPKVFISYSWKPAQHQQKVVALAERLRSDSVDVILDLWDLREGQDKNQFMERMVTDSDIKRVLIICNKDYKEKADSRKGGVGTESMIMSGEIYAKADQTKFIPLIFEADEQGNAYVPVFVHSRIYLDFKDEDVFEANYEQLIRNIFESPVHRRPPLGPKPSYLNEQPTFLATAHKVNIIKIAFANQRPNAPLLVKQYYQSFLAALKDFEPKEQEFTPENFIEITLSRMEQMLPLKDDFVAFLEVYCTAIPTLDTDALHTFFEQYMQYFNDTEAAKADKSIGRLRYDYLRFFTYELLLYFVAALVKYEQYDALGEFLHDSFVMIPVYSKAKSENYVGFDPYNFTLNEFHNSKYKGNRVSLVADKVKERVKGNYLFEELVQADIILHVISVFRYLEPNQTSEHWLWKPETTAYNERRLPFFERLISARHFEKVKKVFGVNSVSDITKMLAEFQSDSYTKNFYSRLTWDYRGMPNIENLLHEDKLAKFK